MFEENSADASARPSFGDHLGSLMGAGKPNGARPPPQLVPPTIHSLEAPSSPPAVHVNAFRKTTALGYSAVLPIVPPGAPLNPNSTLARRLARGQDARGKSPGMLRQSGWSGCDWQSLHAPPSAFDAWHSWGAGVGLRLGDDRVAAVDFDVTDQALSARVLDRFRVQIPFSHKPRIGRAPRLLILVRVDGDQPIDYQRVDFANGQRVELLGTGKQCVVDGIHQTTGRPYDWPDGMPRLDELPVVTQAQLAGVFEAFASLPEAASGVTRVQTASDRSQRDQSVLRGSLSMVRSAVAALPNTTEHFPTRDDYIKVGIAIKAALPDHPAEAFEIYDDWCSRWADPPPGAIDPTTTADDDWSRMHPPFVVGAGWLFAQARKLGNWFPDSNEYFSALPDATPSLWDTAPSESAASGRTPFELIDFVDMAELALAQVGNPLVRGVLDRGSFVVLYGPSGCGKTFVALDIAWHVALGMMWNGRKVRRMRVVYIAAEGAAGARKRSEALRRRYGIRDDELRGWFLYRAAPIDLLRTGADLTAAIEAIAAVPDVGLVIIDTMSRALAGGDENSPVDMGAYVRNLDRLRATTTACVLNVHHTGKDVARGARGHSLLRAATDTELEVLDGHLTATKQREIETDLQIGFSLDPVLLGRDSEDEDVTSCVVRWESPQPKHRATDKETQVLAALVRAHVPGSTGAKRAQIVDQLAGVGIRMSPETVRTHLRNLAGKSLAISEKRDLWRPASGTSESSSARAAENPNLILAAENGRHSEVDIFQ